MALIVAGEEGGVTLAENHHKFCDQVTGQGRSGRVRGAGGDFPRKLKRARLGENMGAPVARRKTLKLEFAEIWWTSGGAMSKSFSTQRA